MISWNKRLWAGKKLSRLTTSRYPTHSLPHSSKRTRDTIFAGKCSHKETERIATNLYFPEQNHKYLCSKNIPLLRKQNATCVWLFRVRLTVKILYWQLRAAITFYIVKFVQNISFSYPLFCDWKNSDQNHLRDSRNRKIYIASTIP